MEEGVTVLYMGWLLLKVCLIVVGCLFFPFPEQAKITHP
jgi:hypothetical protein